MSEGTVTAVEKATRDGADKHTDEELVSYIVIECCGGDGSHKGFILTLIGWLRDLNPCPPLNGYRKPNRKFLRTINRHINDLEAAFKAAPENFNFHMLFAPFKSKSLAASMEEAEVRWELLACLLAEVRERCDRFDKLGVGEHGGAGYQQERAATAARELMEHCGLPLAWSSDTSPYRKAASLFFEAMTGEQGRDMKRACEAMARAPLQTDTENDSDSAFSV